MASFKQMLDDVKGYNEPNLYNIEDTIFFKWGCPTFEKKSVLFLRKGLY